jgi:hypothetical protein
MAELRNRQGAGEESPYCISHLFGRWHLADYRNKKEGLWGSGVSQRALEEIVSAANRHWILRYEVLGPQAVATISIVRMMASVVIF